MRLCNNTFIGTVCDVRNMASHLNVTFVVENGLTWEVNSDNSDNSLPDRRVQWRNGIQWDSIAKYKGVGNVKTESPTEAGAVNKILEKRLL